MVTAVAPEVITYDIEIVYYTTPETEAEVVANVEAPAAPSTATTSGRWARWAGTSTRPAPQADPLPSWGENLTGAFRVDVTKPVYTPVNDTQVAKFSGHLTVSHKTESEVV